MIELPEPPPELRPGGRVRVTGGPFQGSWALLAGMAPRERVVILLRPLGGVQNVILPACRRRLEAAKQSCAPSPTDVLAHSRNSPKADDRPTT